MYFRFINNGDGDIVHFTIRYFGFDPTGNPSAGQTIFASQTPLYGTLYSESFPSKYTTNVNKFWILKAPCQSYILTGALFFSDFNNCNDKLILRDGQYSSSSVLVEYCTSLTSDPDTSTFTSTQQYIYVEMSLTSGAAYYGFGLKYTWTEISGSICTTTMSPQSSMGSTNTTTELLRNSTDLTSTTQVSPGNSTGSTNTTTELQRNSTDLTSTTQVSPGNSTGSTNTTTELQRNSTDLTSTTQVFPGNSTGSIYTTTVPPTNQDPPNNSAGASLTAYYPFTLTNVLLQMSILFPRRWSAY